MIKILKFEAEWCNSCKFLDSQIEGIDLPIEHVDADVEDDLVNKYDVLSLPTLIFADENGEIKERIVGVPCNPKQTIIDTYNKLNAV